MLRYPVVVIHRRTLQQVGSGCLIHPYRIESGVENDRLDDCRQLFRGTEVVRQLLCRNRCHERIEIGFAEFRSELVARIVVMDAVGEPHLLEILLEGLPFGCSAVAAVVRVNRLQCPAYGKIVFEILVEDDIPSAQGGLVEVVDEFLLVKGEVLEAGYSSVCTCS